jgi:hypothetical protein
VGNDKGFLGEYLLAGHGKDSTGTTKDKEITREVVAKRAASEIYLRMTGFWVATASAVSSGAVETARFCQFTSPMATTETLTYSAAVTTKASISARGTFRSGSRTSSAITVIVLKPTNAKKMTAAPCTVPAIPVGKNGW